MRSSPNPLYFELFQLKPRKGDLRKRAILETALRLLKDEGPDGLTLEAVAKELRLRRSHVAYYFPDRLALLLEVAELAIAIVQHFVVERIKLASPSKDILVSYLDATFESMEKYPEHFYSIFLVWEFSIKHKAFLELSDRYRKAGRERMAQMVISRSPKKLSLTQLEQLTREAHNIVIANILEWFSSKSRMTATQMKQATLKSILKLLAVP